ncbi:MAG: hypothetical protein WBX25_10470, partial [Rhodomicrobium sp.]
DLNQVWSSGRAPGSKTQAASTLCLLSRANRNRLPKPKAPESGPEGECQAPEATPVIRGKAEVAWMFYN